MARRRQRKTAIELLTELAANRDYAQRQAARERKLQVTESQYASIMKPLYDELAQLGFRERNLEETVNRHAPLGPRAAEVLLRFLGETGNPRIMESIVRALAAAAPTYDGAALVHCFDETKDDSLKWAIVNTIAVSRPRSTDGWRRRIRGTCWEQTLRQLEKGRA